MTAAPDTAPPPRRLGRNVLALSVVSLLTDASSEMIYPLLPVFLQATLGAPAGTVGAIEGAAESTAALLRLASGWWSDRATRRKPLVVAGYTIASVARPLVAIATSPWHVLAVRLVDRMGKGIRSSPRDALLADSVHPSVRGRAFGFHRAADHAGAVIGPLIAYALLTGAGLSLRSVFWLASVPAALAVLALVVGVRETPRLPTATDEGQVPNDADTPVANESRELRTYLVAIALFTLGNSSDAFLLLRARELGVSVALLPVLWAAFHVVKSTSSTPGGALSDRVGRRPMIVAGWVLYAIVYLAFGRATATWHAWALFGVYGIYFGLTEGAERALVADLVPAANRGVAFGWYNLVIGIAALPASLMFGMLWDRFGAHVAFDVGASLAIAAACVVAVWRPRHAVRHPRAA